MPSDLRQADRLDGSAEVAEPADAADLNSAAAQAACGFETHLRHQCEREQARRGRALTITVGLVVLLGPLRYEEGEASCRHWCRR